MKFSTKSRYAIMSMVDIAFHNSDDSPIKLADISERQNIALNYLEQIFVKLRKAGLVNSVKGPGGGYILAKSAEQITAADVLLSINPEMNMKRCSNDSCLKTTSKCLTHNLWQGLEDNILDYFSSISIKDVAAKNNSAIFPKSNHLKSMVS